MLSLVMKASPITESSLVAIGSALSWSVCDDDDDDNMKGDEDNDRKSWRLLSFQLRADCARYAQAISADALVQDSVDDVEWSAFSSLITSFFDVVLSSSSSTSSWMNVVEVLTGLGQDDTSLKSSSSSANLMEEDRCDNKDNEEAVDDHDDDDDDDDTAWNNLLNSEFHTTYYREHKDKLFLGSRLEGKHLDGTHVTRGRVKTRADNIANNDKCHLRRLLVDLSPASVRWLLASSSSLVNVEEEVGGMKSGTVCCQKIFDAMHLLYEDVKLTMSSRETYWIRRMGTLLFDVCTTIGYGYGHGHGHRHIPIRRRQKRQAGMAMGDFIDYYQRDLGTLSRGGGEDEEEKEEQDDGSATRKSCRTSSSLQRMTSFESPPCFLSVIETMMQGSTWEDVKSQLPFVLNGVCATMRTMFRLFFIMYYRDHGPLLEGVQETGIRNMSPSSVHRWRNIDREMVMAMVQEGITNASDLSRSFIPGLTVPLLEILHRCRSDPPPPFSKEYRNWSSTAYRLIGRADLGQIQRSIPSSSNHGDDATNNTKTPLTSTPPPPPILAHNPVIVSHSLPTTDPQHDGLNSLPYHSCMLFPHDTRLREAARLLRSSLPTFLRLPRPIELSDHDYERKKQEALSLRSRRTLALPVGRGMMTVGTMGEMKSMMDVEAEPLQVPVLCLSGRVPPQDATLAFDSGGCGFVGDWMVWPEFHNGVAAGLRLPARSKGRGGNNNPLSELARTWIVYNNPAHPSSSNSNESGTNDPHNNNNGGPQGTNPHNPNNNNNLNHPSNPNNPSSNTYPQQPNHSQ